MELHKKKIIAAVVIFILILICWSAYSNGLLEKLIPKKDKKTKTDGAKKKKKVTKKTKTDKKSTTESDDESDDEDDALSKDAEEIYNLAHEGLVRGMQQEEFKKLVGDLADDFTFINLKQIYNDCRLKGQDPLKVITVDEYIKVLKKD